MESESSENYLSRIEELENRLAEAEQLIEAIKAGEVDAFALSRGNKQEVFTLQSGDYAYRVLVENFGGGAVNLSEDGMIVYSNTAFHEMLNLPYEKVIGTSVFQYIHPASRDAFNNLFKKGLAGQSKGEINLVLGRKIIPVYISLTSLYPTLPTVGMIITDLSEKKRQEEKLIRQNEELKHNKNFIANVLESTNHGVLSYVAIRENGEVVDFIIRYANELALEQLMLPAEKVIGQRYHKVMPLSKPAGLWERVTRVLHTGVSESHEVQSPHFPGRWFNVRYTPSEDGITCTFIEITEHKRHAEELEAKNQQLEQMNKELQSFAYISSHDMQEPLRKIQAFGSWIAEKEATHLSERGKELFGRMQATAKRMQSLINDLLSYSRIKKGTQQFEMTDMSEVIEQVREDMREELAQKNAAIHTEGLCSVPVIPFQFRQLIRNLVSNSLKFSKVEEPPSIKIKSEVVKGNQFQEEKLVPDADYCHIIVSDNGIGFDPQFSQKIFDVFQRLHNKEDYAGTGIGLSIVKKIVENHNGAIYANGRPNEGAEFHVILPVKQKE